MDIEELRQKEFERRDSNLQHSKPMKFEKTDTKKDSLLHIVYVMTWTGICGGSKIILEHCNRLVCRGHKLTIVCHFSRPEWFPLDERIDFIQVPFEEILCSHIPKCDVIVATYWKEIYECIEQNIAPVVYFEQGDMHLFDPGVYDEHTMSHVTRQIQTAPFIYTVSSFAAEKLRENFGVDAYIIPNAVNKDVFYSAPEIKAGNSKPVIATIGPEWLYFKRIPNIFEALRLLRETGYDTDFIWITPGVPSTAVTEQTFVNPQQSFIGDCLRRTDIYICASMFESFCLPVLEAMTCGAAVITTDCGGIRDFVTDGENGLLIEDGNIQDIVDKLIMLIDDVQLRSRLSEKGLETAKKFDWDITADKLEEYYREVASYRVKCEVDTDSTQQSSENEENLLPPNSSDIVISIENGLSPSSSTHALRAGLGFAETIAVRNDYTATDSDKTQLIHTLLFFVREDSITQDLEMTERCLRSLEKSTYTTVVVFNQGYLNNNAVEEYLQQFKLNFTVIGNGINTGTAIGRQSCFEYVYEHFPEAVFVSELHPDMIFSSNWEDALVSYLTDNTEEPIIGCGIISDDEILEHYPDNIDVFLEQFKRDEIEQGLNLPCIHRIEVLKAAGGYDSRFLKGKQAFEDDSLLVGYHYYYGTRRNWFPKINHNSVVYHAVGGQRFDAVDNLYANFEGLVRQYGAMGVNVLAHIHVAPWQMKFFTDKFSEMIQSVI